MTPRHSTSESEKILPPETKERGASFTFRDVADAESYLAWKQSVPREFRDIVEGVLRGVALPETHSPLPLTNQFLRAFAELLRNPEAEVAGDDPRIANLLTPLTTIKTKEGFVNAFRSFADPSLSFSFRKNLYDLQVRPALEWLVAKDIEDLTRQIETREPESREIPTPTEGATPPDTGLPPSSEDVRSSMESGMEKREGVAPPHFSAHPFYGGYYKQLVFDRFDPTILRWGKPEHAFVEPEYADAVLLGKRVLSGNVRGQTPLALPLPYNWTCGRESLSLTPPSEGARLLQQQDGQWYLSVPDEGIFSYHLVIAEKTIREEGERADVAPCAIAGDLPTDGERMIAETGKSALQYLARARALVRAVRDRLTYSNSPEAYAEYTRDPGKFFERIWERKEADCHVANTLAAAVLTKAGFQCRFVGGYFVKEKGVKDEAVLHAGNGHAWLEVYDPMGRRFVRLDATPKGDPTMDEEAQERDLVGEGDFGENECEIANTEEVKKKIKEFQKQGGGKRTTSEYERSEEQFASQAACTEAQAREFLRAIERVREIKDEHSTPIVELLIAEWKKIIQEYVIQQSDYRGPVRMDEGDRLEEPVAAKIDIASGEYNPTGFEKIVSVEKVQADFGGINIYFSFDLSGSMTGSDPVSGRPKADVQRDTGLLFVDSLTQCAFLARQMASQEVSLPIKLMVTVASTSGRIQLPLTDRWTPKEQWAFYTALAQTAKGGTPIHETLEKIEAAYDQELRDIAKKKIPKEKQPIHYTVELTDGAPDDVDAVRAAHKRLTGKGMAVRAYVIGEDVPENYGASAEPVESFSAVPMLLAKDIVTVFMKLKPTRIKR